MCWMLCQESTEEELERLLDKIMVLFRFIHGMLRTVSYTDGNIAIKNFVVVNRYTVSLEGKCRQCIDTVG